MYVTRTVVAMLGLVTLLAAGEAHAQFTPGTLDPFLCNTARRAPREPRFTYLSPPLTDRFQSNAPYRTTTEDSFCQQTIVDAGQPPLQPLTKLQGFRISGTSDVNQEVEVAEPTINPALQKLKVGRPDRLLIRAHFAELGTFRLRACRKDADCVSQVNHPYCVNRACLKQIGLPPPPNDPLTVDNFKCYRVTPSAGEPPFPSVTVPVNENYSFLDPPSIAQVPYQVTRPTHLCMPVDKGGENPGAETHPLVLMCYQVKRAGVARFVRHRAGLTTSFEAQMRVDQRGNGARELCVAACVLPNCP